MRAKFWPSLQPSDGPGGEILAETDASGTTLNECVYFGGKRIAMLPAGGSAQFYAEDMLGTSRVIATNNGTVCYDADFDPYVGEHAYTNNCPATNAYKFGSKKRDAETGNDDFGARYYTSPLGPDIVHEPSREGAREKQRRSGSGAPSVPGFPGRRAFLARTQIRMRPLGGGFQGRGFEE